MKTKGVTIASLLSLHVTECITTGRVCSELCGLSCDSFVWSHDGQVRRTDDTFTSYVLRLVVVFVVDVLS